MTVLNFFKRRRTSGTEAPGNSSRPSTAPPVARVSPYRPPEEVLPKEAYTHGFQDIYNLENVDPKTVRPMGSTVDETETKLEVREGGASKAKVAEAKPEPKRQIPEFLGDQLELDLGPQFRGWMTPFRIEEPIQVLELSSIAEKALLENGRRFLKDVLNLHETNIHYRGLGQGHIDEIVEKVDTYLKGCPRERTQQIDFKGLLRSVLGTEDRRACYLWLQPYGLEHFFELSPSELAEVRHLTPEKRQYMLDDTRLEIASERKREQAQDKLKLAIEVFVVPWLFQRHGYASEREVIERLERVSTDPLEARQVMRFFSEVYYPGENPLRKALHEVEMGVYAADWPRVQEYRDVLALAKSYFYTPRLDYSLSDLVQWLERECARRWIGYPEGFVERVLRLSPQYRVRRGEEGLRVWRR